MSDRPVLASRKDLRLRNYAKYSIMPERKRLIWVGTSASDIATFPLDAKLRLGTALRVAQEGGRHNSAKPMKGPLREVTEIAALCDDGTYRLMYTTQVGEVIYVLHAFKKKAHGGIGTPKRDLALIGARLAIAKRLSRTNYAE
jgi:phage-related protein